jgi:hypothetical protein
VEVWANWEGQRCLGNSDVLKDLLETDFKFSYQNSELNESPMIDLNFKPTMTSSNHTKPSPRTLTFPPKPPQQLRTYQEFPLRHFPLFTTITHQGENSNLIMTE